MFRFRRRKILSTSYVDVAMAVAFGEKLPIPEIVALGGHSDGKSSLLEALLGFRFNVRKVKMGTQRPLIL